MKTTKAFLTFLLKVIENIKTKPFKLLIIIINI